MISVRFSISLLLIATLSPFAWPTLEYEAVWKVTGQGGFSAANTIQYTKETTGIVVCEGDVGIVLFDLKGQRVWEYPMDPPVLAAPAVADVNGDGQEDIVAADGKGHLAVLDVKGKLIWRAEPVRRLPTSMATGKTKCWLGIPLERSRVSIEREDCFGVSPGMEPRWGLSWLRTSTTLRAGKSSSHRTTSIFTRSPRKANGFGTFIVTTKCSPTALRS